MAEPLFIVADIDLSAPALRRWLKSAPQSVAAFGMTGRSQSAWRSRHHRAGRARGTLRRRCAGQLLRDSFGREDGHLHCRHDEQAHAPGSRRASSMAMRPAPRRPRFSAPCCAGWRRPTRQGSPHSSACSTPTTIWSHRDRCSPRVLPAPAHARVSPPWFDDWISQDNLGDPGRLMVALVPSPPAPLKKQLALGALQASPDAPHHYDSHFGPTASMYRWPGDQPAAPPPTFRRVTPANAMDSAFYTDGRQVWYHRPMVGSPTGA